MEALKQYCVSLILGIFFHSYTFSLHLSLNLNRAAYRRQHIVESGFFNPFSHSMAFLLGSLIHLHLCIYIYIYVIIIQLHKVITNREGFALTILFMLLPLPFIFFFFLIYFYYLEANYFTIL